MDEVFMKTPLTDEINHYLMNKDSSMTKFHQWVPVTTAWCVPSGCGWESRPPDMEVSCEYTE